MQIIYSGIKHLSEALKDSKIPFLNIKKDIEGIALPYTIFDDFTPNPLYEDVCKGIKLFNAKGCDTIIAVGGGSSIDVAKCIKLYCKMSDERLYLEQEYKDTGVKLIAIPTTAGTGSESTRYAVIYYDGKKQSVTHESIIPDVAILEPKVLKTLPLYQKKCTMMDTLCQGIESWWSVNSTDESKEYSKIAVESIMKWWKEYIFENTDKSAQHIMNAANYAGRAICITQTTAPHAFSYKITSLYGLPHGHAVAVCLPEIWAFMLQNPDLCIDKRGKDYLIGVFHQIAQCMNVTTSQDAVLCFRKMMKEMSLANPVSTNKEQEVDILSHSVIPVRLKNNPVKLDEETIRCLYFDIIKS